MNDFWSYAWLIDRLHETDAAVEARVVSLGNLVLVVAARGDRFHTAPVEGSLSSSIDVLGGIRSTAFFSLNTEGDDVRAAFVDAVLRGVQSPKAKATRPPNFFDFFRGLNP